MPNLKELKTEAKNRGLKKYSTMSKVALAKLISLDKDGRAPATHMTNKRKKELKNVRKVSGLAPETLEGRAADFLESEMQERAVAGLAPQTLEQQIEKFVDSSIQEAVAKVNKKKPRQVVKKKREKKGVVIVRSKKLPRRPPIKRTKKPTSKSKFPPKPTFKPPKVSRSMLMKRVKAKRDAECGKFSNLSKKTMTDLKTLL